MKAYNGVEVNLLAFFKLGTRQGRVVNLIARKLQIRGNDFPLLDDRWTLKLNFGAVEKRKLTACIGN
jgi:hypothetical protein